MPTHGPLARGSPSPATACARPAGAVNGWLYPFVREENLDDPRSPRTLFRDDADFLRRMPLTAKRTRVTTVAEWTEQMRHSARVVQAASLDLREYQGWRRRRRTVTRRIRLALTGRAPW